MCGMLNVRTQKYHYFFYVTVSRRIQRSSEYEQNFNHKPILNCENYKPEIKEEQPIETFVIDVNNYFNNKIQR